MNAATELVILGADVSKEWLDLNRFGETEVVRIANDHAALVPRGLVLPDPRRVWATFSERRLIAIVTRDPHFAAAMRARTSRKAAAGMEHFLA